MEGGGHVTSLLGFGTMDELVKRRGQIGLDLLMR
jgi:hypothetical protein